MSWVDKMRQGMALMKEACSENPGWNDCSKCPFDEYCDILMQSSVGRVIPENWEDEEEQRKRKQKRKD